MLIISIGELEKTEEQLKKYQELNSDAKDDFELKKRLRKAENEISRLKSVEKSVKIPKPSYLYSKDYQISDFFHHSFHDFKKLCCSLANNIMPNYFIT